MASDLGDRIQFQKIRKEPNGRGGVVLDPNNPIIVGTFWGDFKIKSRSQSVLYQGNHMINNVFITIRDNPVLTRIERGDQAICQGMTVTIDEITPDDKRTGYSVLSCQEVIK